MPIARLKGSLNDCIEGGWDCGIDFARLDDITNLFNRIESRKISASKIEISQVIYKGLNWKKKVCRMTILNY